MRTVRSFFSFSSLVAFISLSSVCMPSAHAEVFITPRHLIILRPGIDAIWGSYIFAVQNTDEKEAELTTRVMLPKETVDFQPQEGVTAADVQLSADGLLVKAKFPKGVQIVSIGFKTNASYGGGALSLTPPTDIESLTILSPKDGSLEVRSSALMAGDSTNVADPQYLPYVNRQLLPAGQTFQVQVTGLPEGRTRLWVIGSGVIAVLTVLAALLTLKTRPKLTQADGQTVFVG